MVARFDAVVGAQAALIARWMLVGCVHGVMNIGNTTISGETIDDGPRAFMEAHDPATVCSSAAGIDPTSVTDVVNSDFHFDRCGRPGPFADAATLVHCSSETSCSLRRMLTSRLTPKLACDRAAQLTTSRAAG